VRLGRPDHPVGIVETERHRLFDDDVLAMLEGEENVLGVVLRRGRDVDRVDARARAQRLDARVCLGREVARERCDCPGVGIGRRREPGVRMPEDGRQHHASRGPQAGDGPSQDGRRLWHAPDLREPA